MPDTPLVPPPAPLRPIAVLPPSGVAVCTCGASLGRLRLPDGQRAYLRCRVLPCTLRYVVVARAGRQYLCRRPLSDACAPGPLAGLSLAELRDYLAQVEDAAEVVTASYRADVARLQAYVGARASTEYHRQEAARRAALQARRAAVALTCPACHRTPDECECAAPMPTPAVVPTPVDAPATPSRPRKPRATAADALASSIGVLESILARKVRAGKVDAALAHKVRLYLARADAPAVHRAACLLGVADLFG